MDKFEVEKTDAVVSDAFHGTELETAKRIDSGEKLRASTGRGQYLGDGVYFFEGSIEEAIWWAASIKKFERYGILRAEIVLGKCLDLTKDEYFEKLRFWAKTWRRRIGPEVTDAWAINSFAQVCEGGFDTVRCEFPGTPLFPKSRIRKSKIVLCVRTIDNILKVALVKEGRRNEQAR